MINASEIERLITEKMGEVQETKTFYQYASYGVALNEIIINQSLQFTDPKKFNDPFDCNEKLLKISFSTELIEAHLAEIRYKISRSQYRELKSLILNKSHQESIFKTKRKEYKISCFSKVKDEILMWSHYSDKHSGICVGFSFPYFYKDKFILCPANYIDKIQELDSVSDLTKTIYYWLTAKSSRWDYEKEIRAIRLTKNSDDYEYVNYDKSYIKEIVFGCNVTTDKIQSAIRKIKKSGINIDDISFKKMKINEDDFRLIDKKINI